MLSKAHAQNLEDNRKGKVVAEQLEPVNIHPLHSVYLMHETRVDRNRIFPRTK